MSVWQEVLPEALSSESSQLRADTLNLIPLSDHALLSVHGNDAAKFLQGQATCDIRRLNQNQILLGGHCNNKGRMISSFTVAAKHPETELFLRVRSNIETSASQALHKYIVFSKAKIISAPWLALACIGDLSPLESVGPLPSAGEFADFAGGLCLRQSENWAELWLPIEEVPKIYHQLAPQSVLLSSHTFDAHLIQQGIAEICAATQEAYVPQMLNYHLIGGVSFNKGCYIGQEIVARMEYRGSLKKHTYLASIASDAPLSIGTSVVAEDAPGKQLGDIVALADGPQGSSALITTNEENRLKNGLHIAENSNAKVQWLELPYAIPKE